MGNWLSSTGPETKNNKSLELGVVKVTIEKNPKQTNAEAITLAFEALNRQYWWVYGENWKGGLGG